MGGRGLLILALRVQGFDPAVIGISGG